MTILPIGTVIRRNGFDLIIMGYQNTNTEERFEFYYIVSLFPIGFTGDKKSLSMIPVESEFTVICRGFDDDVSRKYLQTLTQRYDVLKQSTPAEVERLLDLMLENGGEEHG